MGNFGDVAICVRCESKLTDDEINNYGHECAVCFTDSSAVVGDGDVSTYVVSSVGNKDDAGKPRYSLVPADAMAQFVDVLTFGAKKYGDHNWQQVPNLQDRYYDALQRHLTAYRAGDELDDESGLHHLAHAMCCVAFMMQDNIAGKE